MDFELVPFESLRVFLVAQGIELWSIFCFIPGKMVPALLQLIKPTQTQMNFENQSKHSIRLT